MKIVPQPLLAVAGAALLALAPSTSSAVVIHFDDITSLPVTSVPMSYAGLNWSSEWGVASDAYYTAFYGNTYGSPSGDYAAFNSGGALVLTTTSGADFDFNGAYFTGWANHDSLATYTSTSITVQGFDNGNFVGSANMPLPVGQYQWLAANLQGIDELRVLNDGTSGRWWLMDNFTYNEPIVVPDSGGSAVLLGLAFLSLACAHRPKHLMHR